jgi:shikimate dehydrogenase
MIRLGLTGYPLGHSLSPLIHCTALAACGLQGNYALFPNKPDDLDGLKDLLTLVRCGEITGLNVTIPHKQNIIPLLDALTPAAQAIGAVNTISMRNGQLTGDNTDAPGFLADLDKFYTSKQTETTGINIKNALVLGAGGSARAVAYALAHAGWDVTITSRRPEQAQELASEYSLRTIDYTMLDLPGTRLIVNTTPVGMVPKIEGSPWPEDQPLPSQAAIYDLVYNPRVTKFVREARASGLPATNGLGMLVEQAVLAFEIWTGCSVPRTILFAVVEEL